MDLVRSLKISTCIVLLVALLWGVCALNAIRNMSRTYGADTYAPARTLELAGEIDTAKADMYAAQKGTILATFMEDAARVDFMRRDFEAHAAQVSSAFDELQGLLDNPDDQRYLARVQADFAGWQREYGKVVSLCRAGNATAAEQHSVAAITLLYEDMAQTIVQWEQFDRQALAARALSTADQLTLWVGVFIVLMFGVCLGCFLYVSNRMAAQNPTAGADSEGSVAPWLSPEI